MPWLPYWTQPSLPSLTQVLEQDVVSSSCISVSEHKAPVLCGEHLGELGDK